MLLRIAFEDEPSKAIIQKIISSLRINCEIKFYHGRGFGNLKKMAPSLNQAAEQAPCILITDLDTSECPVSLRNSWINNRTQKEYFIFRIAVREIESWILADRINFSEYFGVNLRKIPYNTDIIPDPKKHLISIARKSKKGWVKRDIPPIAKSTASVNPNYNQRLVDFITEQWSPHDASTSSGSLKKALSDIERLRNIL